MKIISPLLMIFLVVCLLAPQAGAGERLKLVTTTSTENSGLLAVLLPQFEKKFGINVDVIAVGTGAAIKLGENGDADLILVHAPSREEAFVAAGYGVNHRKVMYNDFIIIGPGGDPAGIRGEKNAAKALGKIFEEKAPFVSRGDDSGTHIKEQSLWRDSGIALEETTEMITEKGKEREIRFMAPKGNWYLSIGQGMGAALMMADEKRAYTLTDRGTYLAYGEKIDLDILSEGDSRLRNPYGVIAVNPERFPEINYSGAIALIAWMTSVEGKKIIGNFRKNGEVLFHPMAMRPELLGER